MDREKALEIVGKMKLSPGKDAELIIALHTLIPELRESEDERARKAALEGIEYLERKLGWDAIGDTDILDVKEYLEKQKDFTTVTNIQEAYRKGFDNAIEAVKQQPEKYGLQKEQKPRKFKLGDEVHWHDDDTNVITITGFRDDAYLTDSAYGPILFCDEDNWEKIEQMPAWSEEDKDKVAQYLHDRDGGMLWSKATEITRDILDMLRPSWKPSEEQEEPEYYQHFDPDC